jgi:hypothetical protein
LRAGQPDVHRRTRTVHEPPIAAAGIGAKSTHESANQRHHRPRSRIVTPVFTAEETQRVIPFLGQRYHIRVSGQDTAGTLALMDTSAIRGHGSPMHVHQHDYEIFVVLGGIEPL